MGKGGGGGAGGAGWPVRSDGRREGEPGRVALGSQGIVIGFRLEEKGKSPKLLLACPVAEREGVGLIEDEVCCCVFGDIGLGIVADDVDDCGSCKPLFGMIGLTSVKLDARRSRLVLKFRGDPASSGTVEAILSCLAEGNGDLERERECLCLGYPESRRYPGP